MKAILCVAIMAVLATGTAFSSITERKVENTKQSAAKSGKLIAFVFYQEYWDPNCPKCVATVGANNGWAKKAIPRQDAVVIEVEGSAKDLEKALPAAVSKGGPTPRVVVTDADCAKVVAEIKVGASKDDVKAFEKKVKDARPPKP